MVLAAAVKQTLALLASGVHRVSLVGRVRVVLFSMQFASCRAQEERRGQVVSKSGPRKMPSK